MPGSRNEAIAEAIRELADDQDELRLMMKEALRMLVEVRDVVVELSQAQAEHRDAVRDGVDRLGTRVFAVEKRVESHASRLIAIEKVLPGVR